MDCIIDYESYQSLKQSYDQLVDNNQLLESENESLTSSNRLLKRLLETLETIKTSLEQKVLIMTTQLNGIRSDQLVPFERELQCLDEDYCHLKCLLNRVEFDEEVDAEDRPLKTWVAFGGRGIRDPKVSYDISSGRDPQREAVPGCSDPGSIKEHKRIHSTEKQFRCEWEGAANDELNTGSYCKSILAASSSNGGQRVDENWIYSCLSTLYLQLDQFESESFELLLAQKKSKKFEKICELNQDRIDELKGWVEKHRYHIKQLETLMRMLDNETVEVDQIKKIKNDVEYYIESWQETDTENTPNANCGSRLSKCTTRPALRPLQNILMNQTLTPIGRSTEIPKPSTVIRKSVNGSVKQKTPIHERTMRSVGRKSYIPGYLERTVLDNSPNGLPFTPMTIMKKLRNNKTMNNTTAVNNTTVFNDTIESNKLKLKLISHLLYKKFNKNKSHANRKTNTVTTKDG
ncbi:unnamed protein product [Oppiella nova]|uniref:CCR4-Not complex component Not N-terminal domain-containing protein n=1 Tax=Oppiella nova TaxID=334625 RepID=A0A7R9QLJ5_9ACAR|nr:unnamed protein product [Oppiella nova]CAG2168287.1 unnamed protein product [Oppiella nova]